MKILNQFPLVRILIPFGTGIIVQYFQGINLPHPLLIFSGFLLLYILLWRIKVIHQKFHLRWMYGSITFVLVFVLGIVVAQKNSEILQPTYFGNWCSSEPTPYLVTIIDSPHEKKNSTQLLVQVTQVKNNSKWVKTTGRCLIYVPKQLDSLTYGHTLLLQGRLSTVQGPKNFDEFNYKNYLAYHHILYQGYFTENQIKVQGFSPPNSIKLLTINWRKYLLNNFKNAGLNGEELAIASAISLGIKDQLSLELRNAYSAAGAMHVLAVSGLHVGIIFMLLNFIFKPLNHIKYGILIKTILIILFLWLYAFITGLSPSVIRAATMFSFIVIAQNTGRNSNIYNTLSLSAIVILTFSPYTIFEVGFQLSYLAVIGIIFLHPYLYQLTTFSHWVLDKAWSITCVSIAAQLATAPLSILYFHQFPTYFLVSNLLVIPMAFCILILALVFQVLSIVTPLIPYAIFPLKWAIKFLNYGVYFIDQLPHAILGQLHISTLESWFIYAFIICFIWAVIDKSKALIKVAFGLLLSISILQINESISQLNRHEITFYHVNKSFCMEYACGRQATFIADSSLLVNASKMQFHIFHHWWKRDLKLTQMKVDTFLCRPFQLHNLQIIYVDEYSIPTSVENQIGSKIMYYNAPYLRPEMLETLGTYDLVVLGSSIKKDAASQIINKAESLKIPFHLMREGALKCDLNSHQKITTITALP